AFGVKFAAKGGISRPFADKPGIDVKPALVDARIHPADHLVAPKQRQSIVSANTFGGRRVGFETVWPVPAVFEARAVPDERIKRCQKTNRRRLEIAIGNRRE